MVYSFFVGMGYFLLMYFHLSYNLIPETYNFYVSRNFKIPLFNNSEHGTAESRKKNIRIKSITESNSIGIEN